MDETYFLFSEKDKRNIADRKPRKGGGKANVVVLAMTKHVSGSFF